MNIIDCKAIREQMLKEAKKKIALIKLKGYKPKLIVFQVGNDPASNTYIKNKIKTCDEVGIKCEHVKFNEDIEFKDLKIKILTQLAWDKECYAAMLQLPLPDHLKEHQQELLDLIPWHMDVDGLSSASVGRLWNGKPCITPATPTGIMRLLPEDMSSMNVAIIGRSNLVGKPLVKMLSDRNATVTLCHSKTSVGAMMDATNGSDIIISAIGKPKYFDSTIWINPWEKQTWIDVGINRDENGKLCGDIDISKFDYYNINVTPVPSGVGILTTAQLMLNVVKAYELYD